MSSIPNPVKEALTVLAGACDELSRVIKELPEAADPVVLAEPVAALGAVEGAGEGAGAVVQAAVEGAAQPDAVEEAALGAGERAVVPAEEVEVEVVPALGAGEGAAQGPAQPAAVEEAVVPAAVPGAAQPDFKKNKSGTKFKTWGSGSVTTNYFQIMQKINKFFNNIDNNIKNADDEDKSMLRARNTKYQEVKILLESANTPEDVQKIINEKQVEFDSSSITGGGTRKPRMHRRKKTQRKRSKTIKKKPKSGNRK